MGWATSSTATSPDYYGGERYSADESVILYAVWIERNYDFSVSDLSLTPSEVYQYEKVGITFKADNWDKNLPYDNIPVEVLLNGSVVYSTTVDFVKYGVQNFTLDLNVGALVGNQSIVVRVNWADHLNETRTGNNSVSATFNVKKLLETSTESIAVIGEYIEGFEVVTSFYAVNEASDDIIPSDGVSFDFVVYSMQGNSMSVVSQQTWSNVVIPAGGRNLVYFKWKVPEGSAGTTYFCKGTINAAKANKETNVANNSTEFAVLAQSIGSSQTPNTRFESSAPSSYNSSITAPNAKAGSATWNMWVYENGAIVLKQYGVSVSAADPNLLPSSACLTAEKVGNTWKIKSGYGVTFSWNPNLTAKYGCSMPSSNAYTEAQYVYAAFPEFSYNTASYKYRTLEQVNGNYQFVANPDADGNARVHFIPVYVEDGDYIVSATATHIWTPAGMISAVRNVKVVIDGTIYDDWYQS
jgi:archaellum component FlaG (FlaF/FlaG flagellin family)